MTSPVLNKLRRKNQPVPISQGEAQRQIALSLALAERRAAADRESAVAEAITDLVGALGLDIAKEVSPND